MSKITQPYDLLESSEYSRLKTILQDNFALTHNEYRPLEEFDRAVREFARDFLRNYLFKKYAGAQSHMDIEQEIRDFELETYGTSQTPPIA